MRRSHSFSKRDTLLTCSLRYFFEYYAAAKSVPFDRRRKELVRSLKEMTGCYLLAGEILHDLIKLYFVKGSGWGTQWFVKAACERFDKAVRISEDPEANSWMSQEPFPPPRLLEFHYGDSNASRVATEARRRLVQAIRNFMGQSNVQQLVAEMRQARDEAQKRLNELVEFDRRLRELDTGARPVTPPAGPDDPWVKQKIAEVTGGPAYGGRGWLPVIDYGVRVNIEPLKVARVLHRAADRVK